MRTQIDVAEILKAQKRRSEINQLNLSDIDFIEMGKVLKFSEEDIKQFEFTGLNNIDFIISGYYKDKKL